MVEMCTCQRDHSGVPAHGSVKGPLVSIYNGRIQEASAVSRNHIRVTLVPRQGRVWQVV
jgi:hypothetical protein